MAELNDITRLLQLAEQGQADAANQLFVLIENDLRQIARKRKREAAVGPSADASTTMLVHDAFCRLVGQDATTWRPGDRRKFFAYASTKIHDLIIDRLREQQARKRGGDWQRAELDVNVADPTAASVSRLALLLDLKEALLRMQEFAAEDALLFRLRFFLECTFEEAADVLGLSKTEAVRGYQRTCRWLQRELKEYDLDT